MISCATYLAGRQGKQAAISQSIRTSLETFELIDLWVNNQSDYFLQPFASFYISHFTANSTRVPSTLLF